VGAETPMFVMLARVALMHVADHSRKHDRLWRNERQPRMSSTWAATGMRNNRGARPQTMDDHDR
jgi:hypothetical protein